MRWKMENPNKVLNLVEGSYGALLDLYMPQINELSEKGILNMHKNEN